LDITAHKIKERVRKNREYGIWRKKKTKKKTSGGEDCTFKDKMFEKHKMTFVV
jgi:hypothetical protein